MASPGPDFSEITPSQTDGVLKITINSDNLRSSVSNYDAFQPSKKSSVQH